MFAHARLHGVPHGPPGCWALPPVSQTPLSQDPSVRTGPAPGWGPKEGLHRLGCQEPATVSAVHSAVCPYVRVHRAGHRGSSRGKALSVSCGWAARRPCPWLPHRASRRWHFAKAYRKHTRLTGWWPSPSQPCLVSHHPMWQREGRTGELGCWEPQRIERRKVLCGSHADSCVSRGRSLSQQLQPSQRKRRVFVYRVSKAPPSVGSAEAQSALAVGARVVESRAASLRSHAPRLSAARFEPTALRGTLNPHEGLDGGRPLGEQRG